MRDGLHPNMLNRDQIAEFEQQGYLLVPDAVDPQMLARLRRESSELVQYVLDSTLTMGRRNPRADLRLEDDGRLVVRRISPVLDIMPSAAEAASAPALVGAAEQLVGEAVVVMESKLNYKLRLTAPADFPRLPLRERNDEWPLHTDWGYYRQQGYPTSVVSVALHLDETTGRGPMTVVPGSHRDSSELLIADPDSGSGRLRRAEPGLVQVEVSAPAGSLLYFHCRLAHASGPNRSDLPRRILHLTYAPQFPDGSAGERRNGRWLKHAQRFDQRYRAMRARHLVP